MTRKLIKRMAIFLGAWLLVSAAVGGCHCTVYNQSVSRPQPIYVKSAPPPAKQEVKPPRPSSQHVWVAGAWAWNEVDDTWEWREGAWQVPPKGHVWVDANYEVRGEGTVVYTPGYWERQPSADRPAVSNHPQRANKPSGTVTTRRPEKAGAKDKKESGKVATRKDDGENAEKAKAPEEKEKESGTVATRKAKEEKEKESGTVATRKAKEEKEKESGTVATRKAKADKEKESGTVATRKAKEEKDKESGTVATRKAKEKKEKEKESGTVTTRKAKEE